MKTNDMSENRFDLLIATGNAGKVRELAALLAELPVNLKNLNDFSGVREVAETGATFGANAALKAAGYARQTGCAALADDSGLEVDALGGAPGIYSARYAGAYADDRANIGKLLGELAEKPAAERSARFVCAMAIADADGVILYETSGFCDGAITMQPRGAGGFGYDPVFVPRGFDRTFGEISPEIKQEISHRALATVKIVGFLHNLLAV